MSQENVEAARRGIAEINEVYRTGTFSPSLPRIRELCDPDFVLRPSGMFPENEEMRGPEGLLNFISGQAEAFEQMWIDADEFIDAGDRVVIPIRFGGRARHTGLDVEFQVTHLCTYREGKLLRDEIYATKAEALEAAGLSK
ncbi:MAG: nuclear transport factor 2 family protein [Solirubrobacterales bacterium]